MCVSSFFFYGGAWRLDLWLCNNCCCCCECVWRRKEALLHFGGLLYAPNSHSFLLLLLLHGKRILLPSSSSRPHLQCPLGVSPTLAAAAPKQAIAGIVSAFFQPCCLLSLYPFVANEWPCTYCKYTALLSQLLTGYKSNNNMPAAAAATSNF